MVRRQLEAELSVGGDSAEHQSRQNDPPEGRIAVRQWIYLASRLPGKLAHNAVGGLGTRRFVEAVLWLAVTDSTWPELLKSYGNFHAAYQRFVRWERLDIWDYVCTCLSDDPRLPALQRMIRLHNDVRRRRNKAVAEKSAGEQAAAPRSAPLSERVQALEARLQQAEMAIQQLLAASQS